MRGGYAPDGSSTRDQSRRDAADSYSKLYEPANERLSFEDVVDAMFLDAWKAEFGISLDRFHAFVEQLEDVGVKASKPVLCLKRSHLISMLSSTAEVSPQEAGITLEMLTLFPRPEWRAVAGNFKNMVLPSAWPV